MELSTAAVALLVVWGTVVALDLVSVPQALFSRPLVAGAVAGWIAGDPMSGLRVGVLFELFALDVLPIGAVRYPDYGPATVAAVVYATGLPWQTSLGVSAALGLGLAVLGGWSLQIVRRRNATAVQRRAAALAAGESRAIRALQYAGLQRDLLRGALLTMIGLALAWTVRRTMRLDDETVFALTLVVIGCGLAAVIGGALRSAGRGARAAWLAAGALVGTIAAALL